MLSIFDWLRRSRSGAELLSTLYHLESTPQVFQKKGEIGPPTSGVDGPCIRCWIHPRVEEPYGPFCEICGTILSRISSFDRLSRRCVITWGFVNFLPTPLLQKKGGKTPNTLPFYSPDQNHFLMAMESYRLKDWLQDVLLHHGSELRGLMTFFPTLGNRAPHRMGDALCRVIHQDSRFPMNKLRVRFFSEPHQVSAAHRREKEGLLTFEASEFLGLLEMTSIFRARLHPNEQRMVKEIIALKDPREKGFYWGRLMSLISQEAKDMLSAWNFRQWPENRIKLLYELIDYVPFAS